MPPFSPDNEKAWQEYEEDKVSIVNMLDQADEQLRNIRKLFDPVQGAEDLAMRTEQARRTREANETCFSKLKANVEIICSICSPDKKEELAKIVSSLEREMEHCIRYREDLGLGYDESI